MALRGDLPKYVARTSPTNTPVVSQVLASTFAIALILSNASKSTAQMFIFLSLLATTVTLVVYVLGAFTALRRRPSATATAAIGISILFSLFAFYGAGLSANLLGLGSLVVGLGIRWLCHRLTRSRGGSSRLAAASPAAPPGSSA
jgi:amino acid transporter